MWFEALKSFNVIPGSLGDLAIVTWFWPQNRPLLTPPCPREKDGRGQSGPNSCFPIDSFHLRRSRVSTLIPGSLGDPAIVTWFWPQNQPFFTPPAHGRRMAGVKEALNYVFLLIQMWFEALKSFYIDSRVPGWPCHCYLKSAIFDPYAHGKRMAGVKVALNHVFLLI